MSDFDQIREQLRQVRDQRAGADAAIAAANEKLKKLDIALDALDRVTGVDPQSGNQKKEALVAQRRLASEQLSAASAAQKTSLAAEAAVLGKWAVFTDPTQGIAQLKDDTPILMMPVRLETRFKASSATNGDATVPSQLWVRVYPDDCWIDSFDPVLTDTEVAAAKNYWTARWQAGGFIDQERAAWSVLASSKGSGRAGWIVQQFQPVNILTAPVKAAAQDVILAIALDSALSSVEGDAVAAYWSSLWSADHDGVKASAAQAALESAVGSTRARELVAQTLPANFAAPLATGVVRSDVKVTTAFVIFPAIATKQSAWSQAPKITLLPDRFVFIGYNDGDAPLVKVGNPVPSSLFAAPDPSAPPDQQLKPDGRGGLQVPDQLRWMTDFNQAVEEGMGFRVDLTATQASRGFKRVLVLGVRLSADVETAKGELETLIQHQSRSGSGIALIPQGTPTNNTDSAPAGHSRLDDPDASFDDLASPRFTPSTGWLDKRDGQWLAELMGVDPALFLHTHGAGSTDQAVARAMNTALWPATLEYWMETMMSPVFTQDTTDQTRDFFRSYVLGGGVAPSLRIGNQPYGILPCTAYSRMSWFPSRPEARGNSNFLHDLYALLRAMQADWNAQVPSVPFAGKPGVDPHQALLEIVGLHPGSVEWSLRYAESLKSLYNRLSLLGLGGFIESLITALQRVASRSKLTSLGYTGAADPFILEKIFDGQQSLLNGGVVDDKPLSETSPIRAYTPDGKNYIEWLIAAASTSLDALYRQNGFVGDKPPSALLYLMLRHGLQLGYHDVSIRLHQSAGLYTTAMAAEARIDSPFLHIQQSHAASESRYLPLVSAQPAITGSASQTVSEFISARLFLPDFDFYLPKQMKALDVLKAETTGRLERAFADHVDCCSYRLDAWILGLVNFQLLTMRGIREGSQVPPKTGVYLGAYGWIENLKPETKALTEVTLQDPVLRAEFQGDGEPPLMHDPSNEGYIHAPSLNHAVAAAVLRTGFITDASAANSKTLAVNLTSKRVRVALGMIEGIRGGQSLADLLGYQFERGLHDDHGLAEVDQFIFKLRKAFPLRADHLQSTLSADTDSIETIEARNVLDGLSLAQQMKTPGNSVYPFGKAGLPAASASQAQAINLEAQRLLDSYDAVSDLALSEGVYQAVLGNYDRVASTFDAYARGNFPPEPDVVRTPFRGVGLTHRLALHLDAAADPAVSPVPGIAMTPRAAAEPGLNKWLASLLPPFDQVACVAHFQLAAGGMTTRELTLDAIGLQPADLIVILSDDNQQTMRELDDRILSLVFEAFTPRPDVPVVISYMSKIGANFSIFELLPLIRYLRKIATQSRPLRASDLSLMTEARTTQDAVPFTDKKRITLPQGKLQSLASDLTAFAGTLKPLLDDLTSHRGDVLAGADDLVHEVVPLLRRAAEFGIVQAGWGFAYDFERQTFAALLERAAGLVLRWTDKLTSFDALIAEAAAATADTKKFDLLTQADRTISTQPTIPQPATPSAFAMLLTTVKRPAFVAKRNQFDALINTTRSGVSLLLNDMNALLPVDSFDFVPFSLTDLEDRVIVFAQDTLNVVTTVFAEASRRSKAVLDQIGAHDTAATAADASTALEAAAKAMLGNGFRIFPTFNISADQGGEIVNAIAAGDSGELFEFLTAPPDPAATPLDFPIDTWLHGVARVRDKIFAWEQMLLLAGAMGIAEPDLHAAQLPFNPGERWYALEFPKEQAVDREHLLYTAHFATAFSPASMQCGLLVDEWSEIIPSEDADTGIAFHFDRPNNEAPQNMLLVTPTAFRGAWQWDDLVDALNETFDLAKMRAVDPVRIDATPYAPFLPATTMANQVAQLTIALNLALNLDLTAARRP